MMTLRDVALMIIPALLVLLAYRAGVRDGAKKADGKPLSPVLPAVKLRGKSKEPRELKKMREILANVEAYDGTPKNQKKVM